jgi:tRNA modification GTPase
MNRYLKTNDDTIAAIATPPGSGGIAIIRISGQNPPRYRSSFSDPDGKHQRRALEPHRLYHGHMLILNRRHCRRGSAYNEVPNSATPGGRRQKSIHGGHLVPKKDLEILFSLGIRPANPGILTQGIFKRQMDLPQAEAVSDIINARTEEGLKQAELSSKGPLTKDRHIQEQTLDIMAK